MVCSSIGHVQLHLGSDWVRLRISSRTTRSCSDCLLFRRCVRSVSGVMFALVLLDCKLRVWADEDPGGVQHLRACTLRLGAGALSVQQNGISEGTFGGTGWLCETKRSVFWRGNSPLRTYGYGRAGSERMPSACVEMAESR